MPLAGWLLRVRPYAGGRFAIGCGWLTRVRLEGCALHNPPRIALAGRSYQSAYGFVDKLSVGADRHVHPPLLKHKTSPAVLIPTGLVLRIATLKKSNRL